MVIFQQENARIHTAIVVQERFFDGAIKVLLWPAKSPDLNVIENVWGWLAMDVYGGNRQFDSLSELKEAIAYAWEKMTPERMHNLFDSMLRRIADIIRNHGAATRY